LSTVQISPFRLSPRPSVPDSQSFRFQVMIFSRSALTEGPNPFSATLVNVLVAEINILIMFRSMCYRIWRDDIVMSYT